MVNVKCKLSQVNTDDMDNSKCKNKKRNGIIKVFSVHYYLAKRIFEKLLPSTSNFRENPEYFDGEIQEIVVGFGHCKTERLHRKFASLKTFGVI